MYGPTFNETIGGDMSVNGTDGTAVDMIPIDYPVACYEPTDGFDGFRLYKIDAALGISEYFSIEHASGDNFLHGCWSSSGYLQARAMVFGGDIMTMKAHSILSHDLTTTVQDATPINLDNGVVECGPYIL
jgi:hypothetical protein